VHMTSGQRNVDLLLRACDFFAVGRVS